MRSTQSLSITLPTEMAEMVKSKVASGEYATESEVISEGLRTLLDHDAAIEKWLVEEVVPTLEEMEAHPERLLTPEEVARRLDARAADLRKQSGK
jgi:putative addiction module CopG family antidote